jgi:hypothetical protein
MQSETSIQLAVLRWWALSCRGFKVDYRLLVHVPNGGSRRRSEAAILKGMGVRPGFPDLMLLVPRSYFFDKKSGFVVPEPAIGAWMAGDADQRNYHALFVELKKKSGVKSPAQKEYHPILEAQGYAVMTAWSFEEAVTYITNYLTTGEAFVGPKNK